MPFRQDSRDGYPPFEFHMDLQFQILTNRDSCAVSLNEPSRIHRAPHHRRTRAKATTVFLVAVSKSARAVFRSRQLDRLFACVRKPGNPTQL